MLHSIVSGTCREVTVTSRSITNGHLLICDWCFRILKGSKMRSLDSNKDVVKSEV